MHNGTACGGVAPADCRARVGLYLRFYMFVRVCGKTRAGDVTGTIKVARNSVATSLDTRRLFRFSPLILIGI